MQASNNNNNNATSFIETNDSWRKKQDNHLSYRMHTAYNTYYERAVTNLVPSYLSLSARRLSVLKIIVTLPIPLLFLLFVFVPFHSDGRGGLRQLSSYSGMGIIYFQDRAIMNSSISPCRHRCGDAVNKVFYAASEMEPVEDFCAVHGYEVATSRSRVIEMLPVAGGELDVLELHFRTIAAEVDTFCLIDANWTHQAKQQPFAWKSNAEGELDSERWENALQHKATIVAVDVSDIDVIQIAKEMGGIDCQIGEPSDTCSHRQSQITGTLESMMRSRGFEKCAEKLGVVNGDVIIISDSDEIVRPEAIRLIGNCVGWEPSVTFASRYYFLSFEFERSYLWHYPTAHKYSEQLSQQPCATGLGTNRALCRTDSAPALLDSGWHCSFCGSGNISSRVTKKLSKIAYGTAGRGSRYHNCLHDMDFCMKEICSGNLEWGGGEGAVRLNHATHSLPLPLQSAAALTPAFLGFLPGLCTTQSAHVRSG